MKAKLITAEANSERNKQERKKRIRCKERKTRLSKHGGGGKGNIKRGTKQTHAQTHEGKHTNDQQHKQTKQTIKAAVEDNTNPRQKKKGIIKERKREGGKKKSYISRIRVRGNFL